MAIESISNAMSYQAQATQKIDHVQKAETDNKEVITETTEDKADMVKNVSDSTDDSGTENENEQLSQQASNERIKKAVEELNKKMFNSEAIFGIHEKTNRVTIKIVDKDTKDVIKEYPPEKTLDMIAKAWELAGLMVDEKR